MTRPASPSTRPALLGAAARLFYAHGVTSTAVDEVAAAARLTKPTLYRHFATKEDLVAAYLRDRHEQLTAELHRRLSAVAPPAQPAAVINWLCDSLSRPGFNGCAFVRTRAEFPNDRWVHEAASDRKRVLLSTVEDACRAAGASDPKALARHLVLIIEGATTVAFVAGDWAAAAKAARSLAHLALAAAGLDDQM